MKMNDESGWRNLDNLREVKHVSKIPIIRPKSFDDYIPIDCPVCGCMFKDHVDVSSYEQFECCDPCAMQWAQPNRKKWDHGWRPLDEEIVSFYENRKKLPTYVVR